MVRSIDQLYRMAVFAEVAEKKSYTAAANALGISKSMVSQHVKNLEEQLETRLLQRTTRQMTLTLAGEKYLPFCQEIMIQANEALHGVQNSKNELSGLIRISTTNDFAESVLVPLLSKFQTIHPRITFDLILDDYLSDLVAEKIDLAVRIGWPKAIGLKSRMLGKFKQLVCASPIFLAARPAIKHPEQLPGLPWVTLALLQQPNHWVFKDKKQAEIKIKTTEAWRANNPTVVKEILLSSGGISVLPDYLVSNDIKNKKLVQILPDYHLREGKITAIHPYEKILPKKIHELIEFLLKGVKVP